MTGQTRAGLSDEERDALIEAIQAGTEAEWAEAIVAARTADLAAQVARVEALATDGVWGYGTKVWLASLVAALSPAQPQESA